jgi:hypothetical protein
MGRWPMVPDRILQAAASWARHLRTGLIITAIVAFVILSTYRFYANAWELGWQGWIRQMTAVIRQLGIMLLLFAGVVALVGLLTCALALLSRWRKVRVFVSYHHTIEVAASEVSEAIRQRWIAVFRMPFEPRQHDEVVDDLRRQLRRADVILVLPGEATSFVDAEILAASTLQKAILFLRTHDEQTTPNTALTGYPVFDIGKLRQEDYVPLLRFIAYVAGTWRDTLRNFARATATFVQELDVLYAIWTAGAGLAINLVYKLLGVIRLEWQFRFALGLFWITTIVTVSIFALSYVLAVVNRWKAMSIVRQKILTGDCTFSLLQQGLDALASDRAIVTTLDRAPRPLRH